MGRSFNGKGGLLMGRDRGRAVKIHLKLPPFVSLSRYRLLRPAVKCMYFNPTAALCADFFALAEKNIKNISSVCIIYIVYQSN